MSEPHPTRTITDVGVLIIGSGFAGIGLAAELVRCGMPDFAVIERADDVGGTWRDNTYPGATCDVPSHLYSFSFAPNPGWTHTFSPQTEIQAYLRDVARSRGVYSHCVFGADLMSAQWECDQQRWVIETTAGCFRARFLISATGALSQPSDPDLPGLADFAGSTFHSAAWDHDYDLTGKQVAVIGTGASSVQLIPEIAPVVGSLAVYQRTAAWVLPRADRAFGQFERRLYRRLPWTARLVRGAIYCAREGYVLFLAKYPALAAPARRVARRHLSRQVADPVLRERLRPHFAFGCKRVLISSDYYPALQRENVELVTEPITRVTPDSIVTADGVERRVDAIVFATGFHVTDAPIASLVHDADGVSLATHWRDGMSALRGTTVPGFPNFFLIVGPNTGLGHTSMVYMIESQVAYIVSAIRAMDDKGLATIEPTTVATDAYNRAVQAKLGPSVWNRGGCRSWYLDAHGRNTTLWPDFSFRFRAATRRVDLGEYETQPPKTTQRAR